MPCATAWPSCWARRPPYSSPPARCATSIGILTHCRAGDEVIAHQTSHILTSEGGSHAALTGVQIMPLRGPRGLFTADDVRAAIRPRTRYAPRQRLLEVEQTANIGGGTVWPLEQLNEVAAVARGEGWATHMDGARLMNACVASGISAKDMAASFDSVWLDFTKGLGAPLGAVLTGSKAFIDDGLALEAAARRVDAAGRHLRGGVPLCAGPSCRAAGRGPCQRQGAGARACARCRASRWRSPIPTSSISIPPAPGLQAAELAKRLQRDGVLVSLLGGRVRACTHLDVTAPMIEEALALIRRELARD